MYSANFFYVYTGLFTHNYVKQICTLMCIQNQNHWCVFLSLSEMFRNKAFGVLSHSYKPLCFDRHFWRHLWFSFMYLHKHTVFRWLNPILRLIWVCLHPTLHGSHTASSVLSSPLSVYSRAGSWESSQASRALRHYCFRECFVCLCARLCRSRERMTSRLECSQDQTVNHRASALSPQTHPARPGEDMSGLTPTPSLGSFPYYVAHGLAGQTE